MKEVTKNLDINNTNDIKELAQQLRCPNGASGLKVAASMNETNISMTMNAILALNLQTDEVVLELGHADCSHFPKLMSQAKHIHYHGLETSSLMVAEASRKVMKHANPHPLPVFRWYNGSEMPYTANHFDKIFTVNTLYFWDQPKLLLQEIYRVMKPGGTFVLVFASKKYMQTLPFTKFNFKLYSMEAVKDMVIDIGFRIDNTVIKKEMIRNKMNAFVERPYYIMKISRIE